jgi:hypothetical protein
MSLVFIKQVLNCISSHICHHSILGLFHKKVKHFSNFLYVTQIIRGWVITWSLPVILHCIKYTYCPTTQVKGEHHVCSQAPEWYHNQ